MAYELDDVAVQAIVGHLNADHAEDTLLLCRTLGGVERATAARATGVDVDGLDVRATTPSGEVRVRLPFAARVTERAQVRTEVVALYDRAVTARD
ncbi:DUF2470 domain-containing protein [Egicoccus halophilus]|uniref:DUF2470 domain-containing protein n=1 Tax=Egicoccus halophilus TaxID=1670830 RepID=A0A8J3ABS2_9ACTN|nr:DUF2470 domain-containing protein [Egicoccus halophilus]GGI07742.1 hypothetical protein GCM10011354_25610 [Egicoccus halophilus]